MPCKPFFDKNGKMIGIACSRGPAKTQKCYVCGKPMKALCDYPGCDKPMCHEHSIHIGEDTDVCMEHSDEVSRRKALKEREKLTVYLKND